MGVTVPTGSLILVWVNSVLLCDFRLHWSSADESHTVQTKYEHRANESHNQCRRKLKVTVPWRTLLASILPHDRLRSVTNYPISVTFPGLCTIQSVSEMTSSYEASINTD
jgi:hypothetical protein